ncbi:MAG: UDP-glucose 6-dehydrogenase, partial [Burkholderiaceae bacterium]
LWGLAFKPGTDDMREAPSIAVIQGLTERGASVAAYDPVAMAEARRHLADVKSLDYASSSDAALAGADALIIVTEWKEFRSPDFDALKATLRQPVIFDGRNLFDPRLVREMGLEYHGIGRG